MIVIRARNIKSFWKRIQIYNDGCWLWVGPKCKDGYGKIGVKRYGASSDRNTVRSHRFSWVLHNQQQIPKGMWVLHKCDNPPCVRPDHLFLGTAKENKADCIKKDRDGGPIGVNRRKTHCKNGHPFDLMNTYLEGLKRKCKTCRTEAKRISIKKRSLLVKEEGRNPA